MKITLIQNEIEDALRQYVSQQGISVSGKTIEVNITAGRGPNGVSAELDIVAAAQPATTPSRKAALTPTNSSIPRAEAAKASEPEMETEPAVEPELVEALAAANQETAEEVVDEPAPVTAGRSLFAS